jgi:hypothetical protein
MTMRLRLPAALVGTLALAACTSQGPSSTPPAPSNNSTTSTSAPGAALAPKVQNPLPASVFSKHPCESALTDAQLQQLANEVLPARHTDDATGPACQWQKQSTAATFDVAYMTNVTGGLNQVYEQQQDSPYHQPLEISGYPALAYNVGQANPVGNCSISVGIADNLVFDVGFVPGTDRYGKVNPCDSAKIIAQDVLENLKSAAQ